jgi:hypothetical protein
VWSDQLEGVRKDLVVPWLKWLVGGIQQIDGVITDDVYGEDLNLKTYGY